MQDRNQAKVRELAKEDNCNINIILVFSPLARILFNVNDEPLLNFLYDDNLKIEPEYYCPIVPMVLVNGADGIGTGWSTKIPNYNIREIVANLKRLINGDDSEPMVLVSYLQLAETRHSYYFFICFHRYKLRVRFLQ